MEQPTFSVQVHIVAAQLTLIHIPLDLYPFYLSPILQLLFQDIEPIGGRSASEPGISSTLPGFLNISVTPVEFSVVCSRELADSYFVPLLNSQQWPSAAGSSRVQISAEDYVAMQVEGQTLDAGQRVLELTRPLAMAGISIFFISTYFSDYVLFRQQSVNRVFQALEREGFHFDAAIDTSMNGSQSRGVSQLPSSPISAHRSSPETLLPSSVAELQDRTFTSLREHGVRIRADETLQLVQCAVRYHERGHTEGYSVLRPSFTTILLLDKPRFLSITVTAADPSPSVLLEKRLLPRFRLDLLPNALWTDLARGSENLLLGTESDVLVPIILDLHNLPLKATGIVCGVAGRMAASSKLGGVDSQEETDKREGLDRPGPSEDSLRLMYDPYHSDAVEISFLSTTLAGTVIVKDTDLRRAMASLETDNSSPDATCEIFGELTL